MEILQILRTAALFPCHSFICYLMSEHRYGKKVTILIWGMSALFSSPLMILCAAFPNAVVIFRYVYAATVALYALTFVFTSAGSVWKNIFLFSTYVTFFVLINTVCMGLTKAPMGESDLLFLAVRTLLFVIAGYLLKKYILPAFQRVSGGIRQGWGMLAAVSVMYLLFISLFVLQNSVLSRDKNVLMEPDIRYLTMNLLLLAIIATSYLVIFRLLGSMNEENDRNQRKIRQQMLENELYYEASMEDHTRREFCDHPVVNALLCMAQRRCSNRGICFQAHTQIPGILPLTAPEITMLLGNILENAWESCEECITSTKEEQPKLVVHAKVRGNVLCMEVKNTINKDPAFADKTPKTTKRGEGIESSSIQEVLKKYKGMMEYHQKGSLFITQIILPVSGNICAKN